MAGKGKVKTRKKEALKPFYGEKVQLINYGADKFCNVTGAKLPRNGMVVRLDGELYRDWRASESAARNK